MGNVPKNAPNEESAKSTTTKDDSVNSKASVSNAEDATSSEKVDVEEGILLPHIVMSTETHCYPVYVDRFTTKH